ncbi:unnamed protein product [Rotaria sp. Silwood1]|nr:unnamed protein product [Rotaria sp. Silwood1]CAF4798273.1 unnamed protein product [Rotaria sp. Silwood1]
MKEGHVICTITNAFITIYSTFHTDVKVLIKQYQYADEEREEAVVKERYVGIDKVFFSFIDYNPIYKEKH